MGIYAPIIYGEIEGLKIGIDTDLILWEHTRNLDYDKLEGEWLIGYGVGFNKGQNLRSILLTHTTNEVIDEEINAILFLLESVSYADFEPLLLKYLENIKNWRSKKITPHVVSEVESFIARNKLQRALQVVTHFYETHRNLIALIEYSELSDKLYSIRQNKQLNKIESDDYLEQNQRVKLDLQNWIKNNTE